VLPISKCREALGQTSTLTDSQIRDLRAELYPLARAIMAAYLVGRRAGEAPSAQVLGALAPDLQVDVDERAAIMEVDGGLERDAAERSALATKLAYPVRHH
jgi:hypothetical protein